MKALASNFTVVYRSRNPAQEYPYSPCILVLGSGRYVFSLDINDRYGKIFTSDDKGQTWDLKDEDQFAHATLFRDGKRIYLLGVTLVCGDLVVKYSDDEGETWSRCTLLTQDETWCHTATDVWYKDGYAYVPMDHRFIREGEVLRSTWRPTAMSPVILRGKLGTDLTKRENWLFSEEVRFRDLVPEEDLEWFGIPFFRSLETLKPTDVSGETFLAGAKRYRKEYDFENDRPALPFYFHATGWLETNVVQITDPKHYWYDPTGKTLHLFMRCNTHGTGYCAMMKTVETVRDGKEIIALVPETVPSGRKIVFLPMPGGQNKFHIKYDEKTKLYWLASVQARDSMTRIEHLSEDRYNIPSDERDRLALHFSKNMVDWVFAGLVDQSGHDKQARHYAGMDIDGEDLLIVSRSGDEDAYSAHDGNLITLHRIKNFRELVY